MFNDRNSVDTTYERIECHVTGTIPAAGMRLKSVKKVKLKGFPLSDEGRDYIAFTGTAYGAFMKLQESVSRFRLACGVGIFISILMFSNCSSADIQAVSDAVSVLQQNKALAEQFVKDVKGAYDAGDPQYRSLMEQYEDARDAYNGYIAQIDPATSSGRSLANSESSADNAQQSAVNFISAATRSLDRNNSYRGVSLDRAIRIPNNLPADFKNLPGSARKLLSDRLRDDVRWKSWSQLN